MILRKPYALLIKNFKKIHLVLLVLMSFIAYKSSDILTFLNDYILTGTFTRTSFSLPASYVSIYMFLVALFISAIALVIYILMNQKKKPKLFYVAIILFYLGLIVYFFYIYNTLSVIEISSISPRSLRVIRDVATVISYAQYALLILIGIRAVGFNIKKFNFGEDLAELEIDVTDNEEFELTVGIDSDKIGRRLRRGRREVKYFIIENLFILSLISSAVVITIGVVLFLNIEVYNKVYKSSEPFRVGYFVDTITDTYYTNLNQKGEKIAPTGKTYAVLKISSINKASNPQSLWLDDINLVDGTNIYAPLTNRYKSFVDLGVGYTNQSIGSGKTATYIFVFEIDEDTNLNKLYLRYRESLEIRSGEVIAKYKKIQLSGKKINAIEVVNSVSISDELLFKNSPLNSTKLKINEIQMEKSFSYDASYCLNEVCNTYKSNITLEYTTINKMLMRISYDYTKDSQVTLVSSNSLSDLVKLYGFIRYTIDNKTYSSELINKTPTDYKGKDQFYQVPTSLTNASTIDLVIRIREKEFIYKLK